MIKAHKIRLNPTSPQETYFYRASGVARFAWNWALEEYKRRKAAGQEIDWNEIKKEFRARIGTEFPFAHAVTKCAAEVAIADLRQAINTYYKTKQANPKSKVKFPGLRKRSKKIGGFGVNNDKFSVSGHTVYVPKLGEVNMAEVLRFDGRILNGRIKERAGRWYLTITVEVEPVARHVTSPQRSVGIDFGLSRFATLSNGEKSETQAYYRQAEGKLKRLQRGLARKKKGSNNRKKWKLKIARAHERASNLRKDFLHKFTSQVAKSFSIVCVEDLCLQGWVRLAGKSTHDAGVSQAINQLEYKTREVCGIMQKVGRFFASSKRCHVCGYINNDLQLSDR
jgi:putative transposase